MQTPDTSIDGARDRHALPPDGDAPPADDPASGELASGALVSGALASGALRSEPACPERQFGDVQPREPQPAELSLGPATRMLWRSPDTVHLELGSRAVVVEGMGTPVIGALAAPRARPRGPGRGGSRAVGRATIAAPTRADARPVDQPTRRALRWLVDAGFLWPRPRGVDDEQLAPPVPRLAGELAALATRRGDRAAEVLAARAHSSVAVHGSGRSATHVASLLAAAGVGRVRCVSGGSVRLLHTVPGGLLPADEGLDLGVAAEQAVRRAAPEVDTTPLPLDERPDLTVLAVDAPVDEDHRAALHAVGAAHLTVSLGADHGTVGPLVLPGLTSCLRCADRHRRDRDPAWSALAAQLAVPRRHGPTSGIAVATVVAGVAVMQALAFLDGEDPATVEGTIELHPPDWRLRRRSWPVHPDCGCAAG